MSTGKCMPQYNFLSPLNFSLKLNRAPQMEYAVQRVVVPGLNLSTAITPTPFVSIPHEGSVSADDLVVSFKVGEDLSNYLEIVNWITALGHPDDLAHYENLKSDCTVGIFGSNKRPQVSVRFTDAFPVSISPLQLDVTENTVQYVTADVTFKFLRHYFEVL